VFPSLLQQAGETQGKQSLVKSGSISEIRTVFGLMYGPRTVTTVVLSNNNLRLVRNGQERNGPERNGRSGTERSGTERSGTKRNGQERSQPISEIRAAQTRSVAHPPRGASPIYGCVGKQYMRQSKATPQSDSRNGVFDEGQDERAKTLCHFYLPRK
jgi:hypothetical protein